MQNEIMNGTTGDAIPVGEPLGVALNLAGGQIEPAGQIESGSGKVSRGIINLVNKSRICMQLLHLKGFTPTIVQFPSKSVKVCQSDLIVGTQLPMASNFGFRTGLCRITLQP